MRIGSTRVIFIAFPRLSSLRRMTPSDFAGKMRAAEFEPDERPSHGRNPLPKKYRLAHAAPQLARSAPIDDEHAAGTASGPVAETFPVAKFVRALVAVGVGEGTIPRHERAVPNSAAPGAGGARAGQRLQRRAPPEISRDLSSAVPLHFLSDLREDVDARGFL